MKTLLAIFCLLCWESSSASLIVVGTKGGITSIKEAISLSKSGDTILIKPGVYFLNNAIITKSITLLGENYPTLHGAGKYELLTLSGKNIRVKGLHFTHSGYSAMNDYAAITMVDASDVIIEDNRFTFTFFGIHVANSHHFTIRNNTLKGVTKTEQTTGNGIHLWKCSHALIENNNATGHRDGIYFEFVTNSVIRGNVSYANIRYGLHFMFSNDDVYTGNTFSNNGAGVAVMFSKKVVMKNNRFEKNWGPSAYGILLKEISDGKIEHNLFFQNTVGVYMEGSNRIEVRQNTFKENGWAAKVQASCSNNKVYENNFLFNTFDVATNGDLVLNEFSGNYWDKYDGYDLNRDGIGDVPYHPVSMYSMLIEQNPNNLMLLRSFIVTLLDKAERAVPVLTPETFRDDNPVMKKLPL